MSAAWLAGTATATLPVPSGTLLGGYADREGGATGTHDELEVSALVLTAQNHSLYLVTADVVAVDHNLTVDIAHRAGIAPEALILAASHTHSGPLGVPERLHPASEPTQDISLRERFVELAVGTIARATAALTPVRVDHGECTVADVWSNRNGLELPSDDRVRWLRVRVADTDRLLALAMLIPCHPTVLGAWNREVSADLHGGIKRGLRRRLPEDAAKATLLTMTGAAGDISTRFTRLESSFAEVDRLGDVVATAIAHSLADGESLAPELSPGRAQHLTLPVRPFDREDANRTLVEAEAAWHVAEADASLLEADRRRVYTAVQGARLQQRLSDLQPVQATISAHILGEALALVTVPGELFSSAGMAIEHRSPQPDTWVIGYANGYVGYLVDQRAHDAATYEALASPFSAEATDMAISTANDLLAGGADTRAT